MAKADAFKVKKKKNGRYTVTKRGGGLVNGMDKVKVLLDKKLIKTGLPKAPEPETSAEETSSES